MKELKTLIDPIINDAIEEIDKFFKSDDKKEVTPKLNFALKAIKTCVSLQELELKKINLGYRIYKEFWPDEMEKLKEVMKSSLPEVKKIK